MKTHKQRYFKAMEDMSKLHKEYMKMREYAWVCEKALKENGLVNPAVHYKIIDNYSLAVRGLQAIRALGPNVNSQSNIADEVLRQLGEIE